MREINLLNLQKTLCTKLYLSEIILLFQNYDLFDKNRIYEVNSNDNSTNNNCFIDPANIIHKLLMAVSFFFRFLAAK